MGNKHHLGYLCHREEDNMSQHYNHAGIKPLKIAVSLTVHKEFKTVV